MLRYTLRVIIASFFRVRCHDGTEPVNRLGFGAGHGQKTAVLKVSMALRLGRGILARQPRFNSPLWPYEVTNAYSSFPVRRDGGLSAAE